MSELSRAELAEKREQTLAAMGKLALNPQPVTAVMRADGSDPEELIRVLAQCPILTARVIGVANSAGSSAIHRMDSIERCVRHLGGKQTRTIALTMAMQLIVQDLSIDEELVRGLWASATTKAITARLVAEAVSPEQAERVYSLGLLQDIALPILLAVDPDFFAKSLAGSDGKASWTDRERAHFGIDHAELGGLLLERWGAPAAIADQIRRHHNPLADDDMAWLAEMPSRFAGLLPHFEEQTTKAQAQTLAAAHTRFLAESYPSLDALLGEVKKRVKLMGKAAGGTSRMNKDFVQLIAQAVANDTFALAAQVSRLDRQLADQVQTLASTQADVMTDPLTSMLNRRGYSSFAQQMLAQARKAHLSAACLVIDLDDNDPLNDELGHAAGDTLLKSAADLIRAAVAPGDLVARTELQRLVVLVVGDSEEDTRTLARRLHAVCQGRRVVLQNGLKTSLALHIGGVYLEKIVDGTTPEDLVVAAAQIADRCKGGNCPGVDFAPYQRAA